MAAIGYALSSSNAVAVAVADAVDDDVKADGRRLLLFTARRIRRSTKGVYSSVPTYILQQQYRESTSPMFIFSSYVLC